MKEDISRSATLIDDNIRRNGTRVRQMLHPTKLDLLLFQKTARKERRVIVAQNAGIGATRTKPRRSYQCYSSQSPAVSLTKQHASFGIGRRIGFDENEIIDSHRSQPENIDSFTHWRTPEAAVLSWRKY